MNINLYLRELIVNCVLKEDFEILENNYKEYLRLLEGKKILITGSCGMITTYLSLFLLSMAEKYNLNLILQCRNLEKAKIKFSEFVHKSFVTITNFDFEHGALPKVKPNLIVHAASLASTKHFLESPVEVMSPNIIGTWNLLNYMKEQKIEKFLFLSSGSIYGEGGNSNTVLTEADYGIVDPLNYRSCYIESKRASEQMCHAFAQEYNVDTSIIRIRHTYGPTFDLNNDTRIIPRIIKKILENEYIEIYKDPQSVIQYTYIADIVAAILVVLVKGKSGEAYNSGGDEIVKMDDVIEWMISSDSSIRSGVIEKKIDSSYTFAKGKGINFVKLSNDKIKQLGWKPLFSNINGFKRTVKSYLSDS